MTNQPYGPTSAQLPATGEEKTASILAHLSAIIATIVLVTTNAGQNTGPGELIKNEIHDQINTIKDFISSHTQQ